MVCIVHSITRIDETNRNTVVVAASHGNTYAGHCAVKAGVQGVILHDAGIGKDHAGLGSLVPLDDRTIPCATVNHRSARIGNGKDMYDNGRISHVNQTARGLGCEPDQTIGECADLMKDASTADAAPLEYGQGRHLLEDETEIHVWGIDSVSMLRGDDAGDIVVTGSHGARLPDEDEIGSYVHTEPAGIVFNDAGGSGTSHLERLAERGIPAVAVDCHTARIGEAHSSWQTGIVAVANDPANEAGVVVGMNCREFVSTIQTQNSI